MGIHSTANCTWSGHGTGDGTWKQFMAFDSMGELRSCIFAIYEEREGLKLVDVRVKDKFSVSNLLVAMKHAVFN